MGAYSVTTLTVPLCSLRVGGRASASRRPRTRNYQPALVGSPSSSDRAPPTGADAEHPPNRLQVGALHRVLQASHADALITGITGQDGQFLAELLHGKGYQVFGLVKGQNNPKGEMVQSELPFVELVSGDLQDLPSLVTALEYTQPNEVYNLGAISFVALSFKQAELTANVTGLGVLRLLEAIRMVGGSENKPDPLLPGLVVGDVRQGPRDAAERADAVLPPLALRLRQGLRPRHHGQLPRVLRPLRLLRHPVQPRVRAAGSSSSPARSPTPWPASSSACSRSSCSATSSPERDWGYAGDYVKAMWAHAPAGRARRLRGRHRRDPQRRGSSSSGPSPPPGSTTGGATSARTSASSGPPRSTSSSATPPRRATAGLAPRGRLPGPGRAHGEPRPQGGVGEGRRRPALKVLSPGLQHPRRCPSEVVPGLLRVVVPRLPRAARVAPWPRSRAEECVSSSRRSRIDDLDRPRGSASIDRGAARRLRRSPPSLPRVEAITGVPEVSDFGDQTGPGPRSATGTP